MTIIVAIQCQDGGVVVAADGAATFATGTGTQTARQPTTKLVGIDGQVIFGHSGSIGMAQRLEAVARDAWNDRLAKKHEPAAAMQQLRNRFWQSVVKDEVDVVNQSGPQLGQLAKQLVMQHFLVALPPLKGSDRPSLIHLNWQCHPEMLTPQLPCVSLGSGQAIADPFLSFIRRVLWSNAAPATIAEGQFAAALTLRYVIESSPGLVGAPEQMMILKPGASGGEWVAEEVPRINLDIHFENVAAFEKHLSTYPLMFQAPAATMGVAMVEAAQMGTSLAEPSNGH